MKRFSRAALAAALLAAPLGASLYAPGAAQADFLKRKILLDSCTNGKNERDCTGYIAGIADVASEAKDACIPSDTHLPQLRTRVVEWLKTHKDNPAEPAAPWVKDALKESYPCK